MANSNYTSQVEPLGQVGTARQLAAGASSANTALSSGVFRISVRATGGDIRFSIGQGTQTATATSHFIGQDERLDFSVTSGSNIAVIRAGSSNGVLEVTELV